MAVGDIQNRFDTGGQFAQTDRAANANRLQFTAPEPQENQPAASLGAAANQPGINNRNIVPVQNTAVPVVNQPAPILGPPAANRAGIGRETEILSPVNQTQQGQNNPVQSAENNQTIRNINVSRRTEENVLLNVNQAQNLNVIQAGERNIVNTANQGVERTAEDQINRIENTNAAVANTPARTVPAANALTPGNQIGTRLDTFA